MAAIAQNRRRSPAGALGAVLIIGAAILALLLFSASRHDEAGDIRQRHKNGLCEGTELYFSPPRGTVLVLCGLGSDQWGGLIYRVTENYGHTIIDEPYEVTVFAASRHYWDGVLVRDNYLPLAMFPGVGGRGGGLWK